MEDAYDPLSSGFESHSIGTPKGNDFETGK